ncbi:MAG: DsrE/DsrF/DrsH-like family protein [Thaumarchaeota archaeon]|nr:DsrE/DsrF/DrsH-like family protein [Nitrososphaerota archaeon]
MVLATEQLQEAAKQGFKKKLVIVVSKGTIDMLYPAFVLATTAPAMGIEVDLYFTFWGLRVLTKKGVKSAKIGAVGNPGIPMPNLMGVLPGMTAMTTKMMKKRIEKYWPSVPDMIKMIKESGGRIHACSPTMGFMGVDEKDLIPEVDDIVGASTFLGWASDPEAITLFI